MYSNENIIMKLHRRRSTTTSDVGESLYSDDLEWDKSDFTRHLPESDALSSYDINEMTEIFRHRFLEFDMSSQIGEYSTSSISEIYSPISNKDFYLFDIQSFNENQIKKRRFYRSLSDINIVKQRKNSFVLSKHLSLMDIKSIQWTVLKSNEENICRSIYSIPQSMEIESEEQLFNTITNGKFLRLSKLSMIRLYIIKIRDQFSAFISQTFQSTKTIPITEEIIETYDIIEG